ncbi:unnamed protein product [Candida verbasci]|uniref:Cytochrome c oxidase assembly protein COX20, mitochondrial n=1 Tax=Candida verbasci TaxID=1227364 RepID=A0A9W4TZY9_9ASCO|nr:unnamed protein product [Candida verbasci]
MGWFGSSNTNPAKLSPVTELKQDESNKPQFLEDLPPKFEDQPPPTQQQHQPTLIDAAKTIQISDFTVDRFINMPCFREAMITGFQAMGVLGVITFLIRKNVKSSINWAVGGFFLGNVVGWEQCRSMRRRSHMMIEQARMEKEERHRKKYEEMNKTDDNFKQFEEFNKRSE